MVKPNFSFFYNGIKVTADSPCRITANGDRVYDLGGGVEVSLVMRSFSEYDAVEWVLSFENGGTENSAIFSDILDADLLLPMEMPEIKRSGFMPKEGDAAVIIMNGMVGTKYYWENDKVSASEYAFRTEYLDRAPNKTKRFANINARSSEGQMPFFDVTALSSGYITAIGWTGDWRAECERRDDGIVYRSGLKETAFYLKPDERIRTSSVLVMRYGKNEDKYNKFRRLIKHHFSHVSRAVDARESILAFELWGGLTSEEMKKRISEFMETEIGFEDVWIDAGWYGQCTNCDDTFSGDWSKCTGDWEVNTRVHPEELRDVMKAAEDAGMRLMLWFEPERAISGTRLTREHPEWFLTLPDSSSEILNYGVPEARQYVLHLLSSYVEKLHLSCYRQDFNIRPAKYFAAYDEEGRRGITEIKHIMGMYEIWDALLEKFPHLVIDNCASGGRRIDIETLRRSIPFFRSDYQCNFNENPDVLQTHNTGISHYLPYNGCTTKTKSDLYAVRSSYSSSWGGAFYSAIFQGMDEKDLLFVKKCVDEYRSIRAYFSMDFYNHGSDVPDESAWAIWQYHDPDCDCGIVMAFRRSRSPFSEASISLRGKVCEGSYRVTNCDTGETFLSDGTLKILLPEKRSSVILKYVGS